MGACFSSPAAKGKGQRLADPSSPSYAATAASKPKDPRQAALAAAEARQKAAQGRGAPRKGELSAKLATGGPTSAGGGGGQDLPERIVYD